MAERSPKDGTPSTRSAATDEESAAGPGEDGRARRRERNHEAIVEAVYTLMREGVVAPTADEVAKRAGLGRRTVFRQFEDLDSLARAVQERVLGEALALLVPVEPTGELGRDVRAVVKTRSRVFEHVAPFRRAVAVMRHSVAHVRNQEQFMTHLTRTRNAALFGAHVAPERRELALEALDLALSFEAWDRLRQSQSLSVAQATEVIVEAALAVLSHRPRASD